MKIEWERLSAAWVLVLSICRTLSLYVFMIPVAYVGGLVTLVVMLMFFIGAFVALSVVQFNRHGADYDKATQLKSVIRFWILVDVALLLIADGLMYPVFKFLYLKHVVIMGLSIANWLSILATLFSLYLLDFVVNTLVHFMPPIPLEHNESGLNVQESWVEITDCVMLMLARSTALNRIPWFNEQKLVGLYVSKWIEVTVCIMIGYNIIIVLTHLSAWSLRKLVGEHLDPATMTHPQYKLLVEKLLPRQYLVYYANGLKWNINFCLTSVVILVTWVMYFKSHVNMTPLAETIVLFGTHTWTSVLICSVLWFFKTCLVLSWEDTAMYTRFKSDILKSGTHLYFLGVLGRHSHDILKLAYYGPAKRMSRAHVTTSSGYERLFGQHNVSGRDTVTRSGYWFEVTSLHRCCMNERVLPDSEGPTRCASLCHAIAAYACCILELTSPDFYDRRIRDQQEDDDLGDTTGDGRHRVKKLSEKKRKTAKYDLLMQKRTPTMHDVKQVSQYLVSAIKDLSDPTFVMSILARLRDDSDDIFRENVINRLMEYKTRSNTSESSVDESVNGNDDWECFLQEVLENPNCFKIIFGYWLENAQTSCLFLGNALSSGKQAVDCLDNIMSCCLIAATFILWLLLTGLATTKVLVVFASPLLAATFIFGETCKTLFQGIMFVYVVHPIHVGDLCSIGDSKMVVKAIGIWTTIFCKVEKLGTQEEVSYPNSELSKKVVVNHLTEFDWDDTVEFNVGSLQTSQVQELKKRIEFRLKGQDDSVPHSHTATVQLAMDHSKIVIHLKYKISDIQDWSYLKCVKRKKKLQAEVHQLILDIKPLISPHFDIHFQH